MLGNGNGNGKELTISRDEELAIVREAMHENPLIQGYDDPALEFIRESFPAYNITRCIGRGGQGAVYEAWKDGETGTVAIKVMNDGLIATRRQRRRFQREIKLLSRLNHPGIVAIYDSGTIQGHSPYFMMPYILGCPIDVHALAEGMDLRQRIELFLDACSAVAAAHAKGIVHRDLKPANIMVDGKDDRVRLLDFGLAKDLTVNPGDFTPSSELSLSGQRVGTARYSSPEQITGQSVGVQSDIYTLGVVLFELLSDELPYVPSTKIRSYIELITNGERHRLREAIRKSAEKNPLLFCYRPRDVRRDLETVLDTAMAIDPDLRYATVDEFAEDLRRYIAGKPVKAHIGVGQRIRSVKRAYRRRFAAAAVIALLATASMIAGFAVYRAKDSERRRQETTLMSLAGLEIGGFVRRATAKFDERETDQAIVLLRRAVELAEAVIIDDPLIRRQAYQAYYNLAEYYFETKRPEEARPYCDKANELSETLQRAHPSDLLFMRLGSYSRRLSGRVAYASHEWDAARRHFEVMLAIRKHMAMREPDVPHRHLELADAHTCIGRAARKGKQVDKAVRHDRSACRIISDLLESYPRVSDYAVRLSNSEQLLALDYMSYRTSDADRIALEIISRARNRLSQLDGTPTLQKRIDDNLASIGRIIATLNQRAQNENTG